MAIDSTALRSRRTLLASVLGGAATAVAATIVGAQRVLAAGDDGTPIAVAGLYDDARETTRIINNSNGQAAIRGGNNQAGSGVEGFSGTGWGVYGSSQQGFGVLGFTNSGTGVVGRVTEANGTAIRGRTSGHYTQVAVDADTTDANGEGYALRARTKNGIAVYAEATGGHALQVHGRAWFDRAGKVTFAAGQASRTISGHDMTGESLVVATIQGNAAGTWVRGVSVNNANDTFTIRLNKAAPGPLTVGWFIVR